MKIFCPVTCLMVVLSLSFSSCDKKPDPAQPTKTDHLTTSAWKLDAAGIDQDKNGTIDVSVTAMISPCTVDNTITFKKDNTGITDEGASKCNSTDPQTTPFNWTFTDAEASINVTNSVLGQLNGKSKILVLNATDLSLTKDTVIGGTTYGLVVNLKH